ncbi:MAG: putative Ig domain-containing protein [Bryobacteraceae bacterium]
MPSFPFPRRGALSLLGLLPILIGVLCGVLPAADPGDYILTPRPEPAPKINGPAVYGVRPGRPLLYRIPCTGTRPIHFAAEGLPGSLRLDAETGIITGNAPREPGEYALTLRATNDHGHATKHWKIVVGDTLALTPPMGWNDWYTHYDRVTDRLLRQAADAMISSGMADFGYQYVNVDDCWMVKPGSDNAELGGAQRDEAGAIRPNNRFPDMRALTAYIHSRGLKAGLYTSPGPKTCAGFTGSYQHEAADARKFAEWGFDFLKYDWRSYRPAGDGKTLADYRLPYELMGGLLAKLDRDIVFNLCQYGMGEVWNWGGDVGGHCWRTTGDLGLEKSAKLPGFYFIGFKNAEHAASARPGRWNDPDYILIGAVGDAFHIDAPPKPTTLTPDEQYSYMSMWSLMAAPLIYSGDMNHLDEFTLNVLCNAEVIDVDQDPLGRQASVIRHNENEFILAKPLEDGSVALGLFNLGDAPEMISVSWTAVGIKGKFQVRDLWRHKDAGAADGEYSATVNRHGVVLVRLRNPDNSTPNDSPARPMGAVKLVPIR